jgi:glycolate oxidase iron-sulfur subunit
MLQPVIAGQLRERKLAAILSTGAAVVATGNLGCITQLTQHAGSSLTGREQRRLPVVHTVELLDWATGGPAPSGFDQAGIGDPCGKKRPRIFRGHSRA